MRQGPDSIHGSSGQGCFLEGLRRQGEGAGDTAALPQLTVEGNRGDLAVHSTWSPALSQKHGTLSTLDFLASILVFLAQIFHASGFTKTKSQQGLCLFRGSM